MFFVYTFHLISVIYICSLLAANGMEKANEPLFYITNNYGKDINVRCLFEYPDNPDSYAYQKIVSSISPKITIPIIIQDLIFVDAKSQMLASPNTFNVTGVIIEAWVTGFEVPIAEVEFKNELETPPTDIKCSPASIEPPPTSHPDSIWGGITGNLEYYCSLIGNWASSQPNKQVPTDPLPTMADTSASCEDSIENHWIMPERCAYYIDITQKPSLSIIHDRFHFGPTICQSKQLSSPSKK